MTRRLLACLIVTVILPSAGLTDDSPSDSMNIPAIKAFLGEGFGADHKKAPPEIEQFGRLVGLWKVEAEMRARDGSWRKSAPGTWAWKYAIDGFAVRDLFYQGADNLPAYMADLGRDYLLTANRIYVVADKKWHVAWMANGAGQVMGADFGTFTALLEEGAIVMTSPPDKYGLQRVVFHQFESDSFRWKSEYSTDDGKTWNTVMRLHAKRVKT